jgi:hypothetical protein
MLQADSVLLLEAFAAQGVRLELIVADVLHLILPLCSSRSASTTDKIRLLPGHRSNANYVYQQDGARYSQDPSAMSPPSGSRCHLYGLRSRWHREQSRKIPGHPEAGEAGIIILAAVFRAAGAARRAHEGRQVVPGASADHVLGAAWLCPCMPVTGAPTYFRREGPGNETGAQARAERPHGCAVARRKGPRGI